MNIMLLLLSIGCSNKALEECRVKCDEKNQKGLIAVMDSPHEAREKAEIKRLVDKEWKDCLQACNLRHK